MPADSDGSDREDEEEAEELNPEDSLAGTGRYMDYTVQCTDSS